MYFLLVFSLISRRTTNNFVRLATICLFVCVRYVVQNRYRAEFYTVNAVNYFHTVRTTLARKIPYDPVCYKFENKYPVMLVSVGQTYQSTALATRDSITNDLFPYTDYNASYAEKIF